MTASHRNTGSHCAAATRIIATLIVGFSAINGGCGQSTAGAHRPGPPPGAEQWVLLYSEEFTKLELDAPAWQPDPVPDDGPFADGGLFFTSRGVEPPAAYRISSAFGDNGWLTAEAYTRTDSTRFEDLLAVEADPGGSDNRVLRLRTPAHTDGIVIRPSRPLPRDYRISLRVGFADFGDGIPGGKNGYDGGELPDPWWKQSRDIAGIGNGYYWLAILDSVPRPHNNVWIHHHRKLVVDSDNHFPPWMEVFDGERFIDSGERPIMLFALDGRSSPAPWHGHEFLSYAAGQWHESGKIRAVDAYLPDQFYRVSIERRGDLFTVEISGRFRYGGSTTYRATIDAAEQCVWHYNRTAEEMRPRCAKEGLFPDLEGRYSDWPQSRGWPDYFMFGDPHTNFYEGTVYYDDVRLEVPRSTASR